MALFTDDVCGKDYANRFDEDGMYIGSTIEVKRLSLEQSSFFLGDAFDVCEGLQAGSSGSCSKGSLQEESGSDARAGLCLLKRGARGCVGKTFKKTPVELFLHSFGIRAGHHQR
ncbi:hypothetical protein TNIN_455472 [Trichonephila inaurata madagascariensis]|uniref:Uncharacterized protein n=1 Tax=Trichonephila inaurata madagascariensis TaxID=2747483 RepID=A0A8X6X4F8_9ARAC|nr:hypothetical protein TNIN_455472 [Trichonephila inaurata madagascariensis]